MLMTWISEAVSYSSIEKRGVAAIAAKNPQVIDLEMGLPANAPTALDSVKHADRIDIVSLERLATNGSIRLVFYEVKHFSNQTLRARDFNPRVLGQLRRYED